MNNHKGFTLIEMIMVIILIGIVAAVIAVPLSQAVKGWFAATSREGISQSGRIGVERMAREIRNTARTAANAPCISAATPPTSTFFSFSDLSGDLTNCNSITFSLSGTNLYRCPDSACATKYTLADNVNSLSIQYYNKSNQCMLAAANCPAPIGLTISNICRLSIEITSTQGGETLRKYEEVYLSNMRIPTGGCIP